MPELYKFCSRKVLILKILYLILRSQYYTKHSSTFIQYKISYTIEQYVFESMLALDSCVVIATIRSPKIARKVIRLFRGNNSRVVLQDVVLKEASRILKISKEEIIEKIGSILKKEVQVFATTDSMRNQATKYEQQYGICHNPDSEILAAAKAFTWTVLTMDRKMIQTAEFEGILALNPVWIGGQ